MPKVAQRIHLEPTQKQALQRMSELTGRSMAAEIREAIDQHLQQEVSTQGDWELLDALSLQAEQAFEQMCQELDSATAKLTSVLDRIERLRETTE